MAISKISGITEPHVLGGNQTIFFLRSCISSIQCFELRILNRNALGGVL